MLYVVSTPIGNLRDMSLRAIDALNSADLILAEDTRKTGILLQKYSIKTRMLSFNDHNKEKRTRELIEQVKKYNVAIVSDAGTPGISDPGFYLVRECVRNRIKVSSVPGASALLSALVCSGLPTDKFCFLGFLPRQDSKKREILDNLPKMTVVLYEGKHRLLDILELMSLIIPDKDIVIARELTKKFEEFIRGKPGELFEKLKDRTIKGEFVIIISK